MLRRTSLLFSLLATCFALASVVQPAAARPIEFGAWTPGAPFNGDLGPIEQLQGSLNRRVAIVHWFQDFGTDKHHFKLNVQKATRRITRSGRKAMLTWEPYVPGPWENWRNARITRGAHDAYIKRWAKWAKQIKRPLYVRFAHEMNGNWYPWGGMVNNNSPKKFKRMWRHVVKVVRSQGATNVKWVWSPLTEDQVGAPKFTRYYPGNRYVDILGMSGFNWGAGTPEFGGWRTFKKVFRKGYKKIRRVSGKPIWITEVASASDGGDKAKWVRDMWTTASKWKRISAIVWYNQDKERDWSTAAVASSFAG